MFDPFSYPTSNAPGGWPAPSPVPPPPTRPKWYTRKGVQLVAVAFVALGVGGAASDNKTAPKAETINTTTTVTATATLPAPAPVTTTVKVPGPIVVKTATVTAQPPAAAVAISDGTYLVGTDIKPGTYRTAGSGHCYWERLSGLTGELNDILANDNITGPAIVTILGSDKAFTTTGGCDWTKIG